MVLFVFGALVSSCHREEKYDGRTVAEWYVVLGSNSPAERSHAATIIAQSAADHPESGEALLRALSAETDPTVHMTLAGALAKVPPSAESASALQRLMRDEHPSVRIAAVEALASVARRSRSDRARLTSVIALSLRDVDHDVRLGAARALATAIDGDTALVVIGLPALQRVALLDPISSVRDEVVGILATLPIPDSAFVAVVGERLEEYSASTQLAALRWIAQHPHLRNKYLASLRKLAISDDYRVRAGALGVVGSNAR